MRRVGVQADVLQMPAEVRVSQPTFQAPGLDSVWSRAVTGSRISRGSRTPITILYVLRLPGSSQVDVRFEWRVWSHTMRQRSARRKRTKHLA